VYFRQQRLNKKDRRHTDKKTTNKQWNNMKNQNNISLDNLQNIFSYLQYHWNKMKHNDEMPQANAPLKSSDMLALYK